MIALPIEPLTSVAFAPFGSVIESAGAAERVINQGRAVRYHDLAPVDVTSQGGRPILSIFAAQPWPRPIEITMLECHPLGSQAFVPLDLGGADHWLIVVAGGDVRQPDATSLRCFRASCLAGVNYGRGTWHHPLLVLAPARFLVVDRAGPGDNLLEVDLPARRVIVS